MACLLVVSAEHSCTFRYDPPIVATTLNNPLATRSISSSISCSVDDGELSLVYVEYTWLVGGGDDGPGVGAGGAEDGGVSENNDGDGEMKERYWSITCATKCSIIMIIGAGGNTHLLNEFPGVITRN